MLKKNKAEAARKAPTETNKVKISIDDIPYPVIFFNSKQILQMNKLAEELLEQSLTSILKQKKTIHHFIDNKFHTLLNKQLKALTSNKIIETGYIQVVSKKKSTVIASIVLSKLTVEKDRLVQAQFFLQKANPFTELNSTIPQESIQTLFDNLPGMAYRSLPDENLTKVFVSEGCKALTGYTPKSFINKNPKLYSSLIYGEDRKKGIELIKKAVKSKKSFELEYRIKDKAGNIKWVLEKGEGLKNQKGQLVYIEGFITDITNKKKIETETNQNWINYKNLIDFSPVAILILDNFKITFLNPEAHKLFQISPGKPPIGKDFREFLKQECKKKITKRIEQNHEQIKNELEEYYGLTAKGKDLSLEIRIVPVVFNGKKVIQVICHDISVLKELENEKAKLEIAKANNAVLNSEVEQRKQTEKILNETHNYLRSIIDSSLDMICASDKNGFITEFNKAAQDEFGYTLEEVIGKHISILYKNDKQKDKIITDLLGKTGHYEGEVVNLNKEGKEFVAYLSAAVLKDENGKSIGSMGVSRNISELKRKERIQKQSEENYRLIFDQAFIGIARIDINNGKFLEVNEYLCDLLEYNRKELLQLTNSDVIDNYDNIDFSLQVLSKKEKFFYPQKIYYTKTGKQLFINISSALVRDLAGNPIYFIVSFDDVSEQKHNEKELLKQTAKLKAIFESSSHLIWTVNKQFQFTSFNRNFYKVVVDKYNKEPQLNRYFGEQLTNEEEDKYSSYWKPKYQSVFEGNNLKFEIKDFTTSGNVVFREVFLHPIFDNNFNIIEVSCIAHNITETKEYEQQLEEKTAKITAIFESGDQLMWTVDRKFNYTSFNRNFLNDIRESYGLDLDLTKDISYRSFLPDDLINFWDEKYNETFLGKALDFEYNRTLNGKVTTRQVYLYPVKDNKGVVNEISGIANDITARRKIEEEKNRQTALINSIFQSSSHMIYTVNKDFVLTSFNKSYFDNAKEIYGIEVYVGFKLGNSSLTGVPKEEYELRFEHHQKALKGQRGYYTFTTNDKNGQLLYFETFLDPIFLRSGEIEEVSYLTFDITDKYLTEQKIKSSLKEKEVLLKEVHHRVKNNLQVISSILNLQSSYLKDENTIQILRECQNRIKSMAFIHESLYQTKNFDKVFFNEYLVHLVKNIYHSYSQEHNTVKLNFDLEEVYLNLDNAITCGLIVNELVSNSFKYAFPNNRNGLITIKLKMNHSQIEMTVADNGIGLPEEIDYKKSETLGLQLVMSLVEQIDGIILLDTTKGTNFTLTFNNN